MLTSQDIEAWRVPGFFILYVGAGHNEAIRRLKQRKGYEVMTMYTDRKGKLNAVQFKVPNNLHRGLKNVLKRLDNGDYDTS
ncbi:hypothetical protein ACMGD3_09510 [Lysinibacillus sphaericus]|uniref:hypothetical protein n=1 Tax=Lysinibacillus sphaericus TaxID=1421 RepID=UPI003F791E6F